MIAYEFRVVAAQGAEPMVAGYQLDSDVAASASSFDLMRRFPHLISVTIFRDGTLLLTRTRCGDKLPVRWAAGKGRVSPGSRS